MDRTLLEPSAEAYWYRDMVKLAEKRRPIHTAPARLKWADLIAFSLSHGDGVPLFRQVYLKIRSVILDGTLAAGSRLPSTRRLAATLGISRTSIISAYDQLLAEGYVESRTGAGTYVSGDISVSFSSVTLDVEQPGAAGPRSLSRAGETYAAFGKDYEPAEQKPFSRGCCSVDALTLEAWRRVGAVQLKAFEAIHLRYSHPQGEARLRSEIVDYLRAARSVSCEADQVIIVSGAQQVIDISIRALLDVGDEAWIEDPGYFGVRAALVAAGVKPVPVPVDGSGLDVKAGVRMARDARAAYVTPSHQFPTGAVMSVARRQQLLEWARDRGSWIIEDDYDSEFRYAGHSLASLQGIDRGERVIYAGTLSKLLFPGIRIGYAVVPRDLIDVFRGVRILTDRQPPTLQQSMVAEFMRRGYLTSHVQRMRQVYLKARDIVTTELMLRLSGLAEIEVPEGGIQLVVWLNGRVSDVAIAREAARSGIVVGAVSKLYLESRAARQGLLLGFSGFDHHQLRSASIRVAELIQDHHRRVGSSSS